MKHAICFFILLSSSLTFSQQYASDHYSPTEILVAQKIDSCKIFNSIENESSTPSQVYIYNENGLEIEDRNLSSGYSNLYAYNDNNLRTSRTFAPHRGGINERDTLIYNKEDRLIQEITYSSTGEERSRHEYEYLNGLLEVERYLYQNELKSTNHHIYDHKKQLIEVRKYADRSYRESDFYEYNELGTKTKFYKTNDLGDTLIAHDFKYNAEGLLTEQLVYSEGKLTQRYITIYDDDQLISYQIAVTRIRWNDPQTGTKKSTEYHYSKRD